MPKICYSLNEGGLLGLSILLSFITLILASTNDLTHVQIFQKLFSAKRKEQKEAVKSLLKYDYTKQHKFVETIASKSIQVLEECEVKLREGGYVPGMDFPTEEGVQDVLSLYLENTAFMSEVLLYLPEITHRYLKAEKSRVLTFTWGIFFASQSTFIDAQTKKLINLASQELGIAEKEPNYVNPYKFQKKNSSNTIAAKSPVKKEKKKFKKGPRLSGEL